MCGGEVIMQKIKIFSDGAARGNPGAGGYGSIVKYIDDNDVITKTEEFTEGFKTTTNNRMELLGVIVALESLKEDSEVTVTSDSKYVTDAFNQGWVDNWKKNGWQTSTRKPVKNTDLWDRLLKAMKPHKVTFVWIKGHAGHPENERCDYLATSSADGVKLIRGDDGIFAEYKSNNEESEE